MDLTKKHIEQLIDILSVISDKANCAKVIYPSREEGYTYNCIYHRDMSLIHAKNAMVAKEHLQKAQEDLRILKVISPTGALTNILENDLEALSKRYE